MKLQIVALALFILLCATRGSAHGDSFPFHNPIGGTIPFYSADRALPTTYVPPASFFAPPALDSVSHHLDTLTCIDTIDILNTETTPIDTVEIRPTQGVFANVYESLPVAWQSSMSENNLILYGGTIPPQTQTAFLINYTGEQPGQLFDAAVVTRHTSGAISAVDSVLGCNESDGVTNVAVAIEPASLRIIPNPLSDHTEITLTTHAMGDVQLNLLNVLGQTVHVVRNGMITAGEHTYTLDETSLPAGTYYLRFESNGQVLTKKVVIER